MILKKSVVKIQNLDVYHESRPVKSNLKSLVLFLKKPLYTGDLSPTHKIFIKRPEIEGHISS